ncbi:MAG: Ig-like domain-containing protein [Anaerolineae bacterium]|nr:Ig-like domain-containing protein [Anaerolineae bacterium]
MKAQRLVLVLVLIVALLGILPGRAQGQPPYPCSIWPDPVTPTLPSYDNFLPIEVGLKFRSDVAGYVTGVRFFKWTGATGTHIGRLWAMDGSKLAEVTFTGETASGWQEAIFPAPIHIVANTTYIISYYVADGNRRFSDSQNYFNDPTTVKDNPPLHALEDGVDGANGVYSDTGGFFNQSYHASNYWVDLIFDPTAAPDTTPPLVSSVSPQDGATEVSVSTDVTVAFDEAMDATTVHTGTIELRDPLNNLVSSAVSYNSATWTAVLDPAADLDISTTYTVRVVGGSSGVADLAGNALAADHTSSFTTEAPDTIPPEVASVKPIDGVTRLRLATRATVYFNEAMDPSTIDASTFELRAPGDVLVPASVTYDPTTESATLDPTSDLDYAAIYTATIRGGTAGVRDAAGNAMAADYTWSFGMVAERPPVDQGPGGPILVITNSANLFTRYYAEIIRTEGLNEFEVIDVAAVTEAVLAAYDVAILGDMALTADQVTMLTDWVTAGGHLIAMRPDKQLAGLLGLADASTTVSDAYLLIDNSSSPGAGIVGQSLQFHGTADAYTLNGATSLATIYADLTTPTVYPAVTLHSVGANGGLAAAFTFDLARSIVYTHQGNPAWQIGHVNPLQSYGTALDLFYPDWIDFDRISIPQADEQQRFLANLILYMNRDKKPLPRFWYFPSGHKAVIILTGDDHWGRSTPSGNSMLFFERHKAQSPPGCSVEDWECVRSSSYGYEGNLMTDAQAAAYTAEGFEFGLHPDGGLASGGGWCGTWPSDMPAQYAAQLEALMLKYASIPVQGSERAHCYSWFGYTGGADWHGYAGKPEIEADLGIRLSTSIAYNPASWATVNPAYQMGSAMLMRFAQVALDGTMTDFLDTYNGGTQMTDDNGQGAAAMRTICDSFLDAALGSLGYYGAFVVNMHSDNWYGWSYSGSDQVVASAQAHGVPVVSGRQMVDWLDGRNSSSFSAIAWDGTTLSFDITTGAGARNLQGMVPTSVESIPLNALRRDGAPVSYTAEIVKGVEYAFFAAEDGSYSVTYEPDTTPPVISDLAADPTGGQTATISWTTDEPSTSRVDYGTDPGSLVQNFTDAALVTGHTVALAGLSPNTDYYYRVSSADASGNSSTSPAAGDPPATFTTPSASLIDTTVADFGAGTPDENLTISQMADGEVILMPVVGAEFSGTELPPDWVSATFAAGGTAVVADGLLTVDGARAGPDDTFDPGHSLEAVATFGAAPFQHLGFGVTYLTSPAYPWAIISTGQGGTGLLARTWNGTGDWHTETSTAISGDYLGTAHHYRVDWHADHVDYYVDGTHVASHAVAISTPMRPLPADSQVGGPTLSVDWLRMGPYAPSGTFISRVWDTYGTVDSGTITWDVDTPAGTAVAMSMRTGNTPAPDASWSGFASITNGAAIGSGFRYLQYRAELSTTDTDQTPALEQVRVVYNVTPDIVPPTVVSRSPAPNAVDVDLASNVTVQFSEAMDPATIGSATFRLRASGATEDVPAAISYNGLTATLDPTGLLAFGTTYEVTLAGSVTDVSGNPLGSDVIWTFTTVTSGSFIDTLVADFGGGTPDSSIYIAQAGDGELMLAPAVGAEFFGTSLPPDWSSATFAPGGTAVVAGGTLTVDGARAGPNATYTAGHSLEAVATFGAAQYQHLGFGVTYGTTAGNAWAIISTGSAGTGLLARSWDGTLPWNTHEVSTPIDGDYFDGPHHYRVDWYTDHIDYYVDGVQVASHAVSISIPMRPLPADSSVGGANLVVDWLHMSPCADAGTFVSRVFDAGQSVYWLDLSWLGSQPDGTSVAFETRTGDTAVPDGSWSGWATVNSPIASPAGRYLQYRATLTTSDVAVSPIVELVSATFSDHPTAVALASFRATPGAGKILVTWETVTEIDNLGFNLLRSAASDGNYIRLNRALVPSQAPGMPGGARYTWTDNGVVPGTTYYYRLQAVDMHGGHTLHGPVWSVPGPAPAHKIYLPIVTRH